MDERRDDPRWLCDDGDDDDDDDDDFHRLQLNSPYAKQFDVLNLML